MSFSAFCLNITLFCLQTGTKVACNKVSSKVSQQTYIEWNNDVLCWFSYCTTCSLMALPKPNYTRVENRPLGLGCCLLRVPVQNLSYDCQFFFFHANQTHLIWKVLHQNLFWNRGKRQLGNEVIHFLIYSETRSVLWFAEKCEIRAERCTCTCMKNWKAWSTMYM